MSPRTSPSNPNDHHRSHDFQGTWHVIEHGPYVFDIYVVDHGPSSRELFVRVDNNFANAAPIVGLSLFNWSEDLLPYEHADADEATNDRLAVLAVKKFLDGYPHTISHS